MVPRSKVQRSGLTFVNPEPLNPLTLNGTHTHVQATIDSKDNFVKK